VSWYKEYKEEWTEIIETVAAEEHRQTQMIEKDTIQSMILFKLSKSELPFVFKGGTSLSKAYGLIDRFSEDIDFSMNRKPTESEKKKTKKLICASSEELGLVLSNADDIQSRHSYNKYIFKYESLFSDIPLELIVETSFYQEVYPVETHAVGSFVGKFCEKRGVKLPIPFEEALVNMQVQSLERTFIDKVFAICDYRLQDMQDRDSRHLYDIAKLLPEIKITPELDALIDDVRDDRMQSKNNPAAQPEHDIPAMLKEIISSRFYESDYNNITKKLLYEDVSYEEAIAKGIAQIADMDIFKYKK
jgi:predicted nucleotidyltransferase component of viral defense system